MSEVVPMARERRTYDDALVEQLTEKAIAAANKRLQAIIYSDAAKGRRDLAMHLAFQTDLPADEALRILAVTPVSVASTDRVDEGVSGDFVDYVARARQRPRGRRS